MAEEVRSGDRLHRHRVTALHPHISQLKGNLIMTLRTLVATAIAAVLAATMVSAAAQTSEAWPAKTTTIVVGYSAASGTSLLGRFLADSMRKLTGQPFIVENRPGAFGKIGAEYVARAKPDGYTVLVSPHVMAIHPHVFRDLQFNPRTDFKSVTTLGKANYLLVVNPAVVPVSTVSELISFIKARPGLISYGSGNATVEVAAAMFKNLSKLDAVNVRYNGVPAAINDLLGGRIHFIFADSVLAVPNIQSGKVRALGVAASNRMSLAPEVPTMVEAGVAEYEDFTGWIAAFVPANTPVAIAEKFAKLANEIMASEDGRVMLPRLGLEPFPSTPEKTEALYQTELVRWGRLVKSAGIEPE